MTYKSVVGVDLGGTNIRLGRVSDGSADKIISAKISAGESKETILNEIINAVNSQFDEEISGIGIGVPSVVDVENGIVYDVHNIPSWREVHLKEILQDKFNVPVQVNNDVNCFVLGEKYFGKAKDYRNIVGLALGTGLGGGIIIDNNLYSGSNCGAGEFGLMPYGNHNYEYYCSGQFFKNEYGLAGEEVFIRANQGDTEALDIFSRFGKHLGNAILSILYSLDPEIIILGGSISNSMKYFEGTMLDVVRSFDFKNSLKALKIEKSELEYPAVFGAAMLCEIVSMKESEVF